MSDFLEMQIMITKIKSSVGGLSCREPCKVPVSPRRGLYLSEGGADSNSQLQGTRLPRTTCILKALLLGFLESGPADTFKPHPLFGLVCFAVVLVAIIVEAGSFSLWPS